MAGSLCLWLRQYFLLFVSCVVRFVGLFRGAFAILPSFNLGSANKIFYVGCSLLDSGPASAVQHYQRS